MRKEIWDSLLQENLIWPKYIVGTTYRIKYGHCWSRIYLEGRCWGGIARDNHQFIDAVFCIFCTGSPWRDLPPDYGNWSNTHRHFIRWRDKEAWERLLEALIDEPDYEWLMIDASNCKVHAHAAGAKGSNQDMSRTKGGSAQRYIWPWTRMVCGSELFLRKVPEQIARRLNAWSKGLMLIICWQTVILTAMQLLNRTRKQGIKAAIPPKKNRTAQRFYDKELFKLRHLVENAFLYLKRWRGIATRYAKNTASFSHPR